MVFYIEACESGSMFSKLLKSNINGKDRILSVFWTTQKTVAPKTGTTVAKSSTWAIKTWKSVNK